MTSIGERSAEIADRRVLGYWEAQCCFKPRQQPALGDLLIDKAGKTAMGTLVDRTSRFLIPVSLPVAVRASRCRASGFVAGRLSQS